MGPGTIVISKAWEMSYIYSQDFLGSLGSLASRDTSHSLESGESKVISNHQILSVA